MSEVCCRPLMVERGRSRAYRRVLWIVLGVNLTMFIVEMIAGLSAGSVSLQADSLDFFGYGKLRHQSLCRRHGAPKPRDSGVR